jgi:hypothetical protein
MISAKNSFIIVLLSTFSVPLSAQDWLPSPLTSNTIYNQTIGSFNPDYLDKEARVDQIRRVQKRRLESPPPPVSLTFKPSQARRQQSISDFLKRVRAINPSAEETIRLQLSQADIFSFLQTQLSPLGFDINNVADAYSVYWISLWEASNGLVRPSNATEMAAVKAQVTKIMESAPQFSALNPLDKQAYSDDLYLTAIMLGASLEAVKNDKKQLMEYAAKIKKQANAQGFEIDSLTLTEDGFVPVKKGRKTGDASGVGVGVGADRAMASAKAAANPADDGGDASPNYVLFAALGSATLGGMYWVGKAVGRKG